MGLAPNQFLSAPAEVLDYILPISVAKVFYSQTLQCYFGQHFGVVDEQAPIVLILSIKKRLVSWFFPLDSIVDHSCYQESFLYRCTV